MPQQQGRSQGERDLIEDLRQSVSVGQGIAQAIAATVEPLIRKPGTHGDRFYGRHALLGYFMLMPFYVVFWRGEPTLDWLLGFWAVSLAALFVQQGARRKREAEGIETHSQYGGDSVVPGKSQGDVKRANEPFLVLAIGFAACIVSPPLGVWLMLAGLCLGVDAECTEQRFRQRIRQMKDAQIENDYLAQRMRKED